MSGSDRAMLLRGARLADGAALYGGHDDLLVRDGRIEAVGVDLDAPGETEVVDLAGCLVVPGLVNAHTHSHYTLAKGLSGTWTLEMHLNAGAWMGAGRCADDLRTGALLGAAEMLLRGCTACYDMPLELPMPSAEGTDLIAGAYRESGLRATLSPMVADRTFWHAIPGLMERLPPGLREPVEALRAQPAAAIVARLDAIARHWRHDPERVRFALAPTIPLLCEDGFLLACRDLAREHGLPVHTHLAESKVQAVAGLRRYGKSLAAHLDDLGLLGPWLTAAHAVWIDDDDVRRFADRGVHVAHNPGSNMRLGNGLAPVRALLDAGVNVGIGTDTCTCSDHLNMFETMRLAALASRLGGPDYRRWVGPREALRMATEGSARALGLERCGRLEAGWHADLVVLDLAALPYVPLNDVVTQLVLGENGAGVSAVMVAGRFVVRDGALLTVDLDPLRARAQEAAERLREANAGRRRDFDALSDLVGHYCVGLASEPHPVHRYVGTPPA